REMLPGADVPDHHSARTVISFRNNALKIKIRDRMILNLHSEPLVGWIERRPLGHSPGFEHAFHLQPEVVVQACGAMFLHYETMAGFLFELRRRLGGLGKTPL